MNRISIEFLLKQQVQNNILKINHIVNINFPISILYTIRKIEAKYLWDENQTQSFVIIHFFINRIKMHTLEPYK